MTLTDYYTEETLNGAFESGATVLLFVDFYEECLEGDYKEASIQSGLSHLKKFLADCDARGITPDEATEKELKKYLRRLQSNVSDSALSSTLTVLGQFYDWVCENGRADDPTENIALDEMFQSYKPGLSQRKAALTRQLGRDELHTITPADVDKLCEYAGRPKTRNELLIRLGFQTTMRPSELANARIENISWDRRRIEIQTAKAEPDHPYFKRFVYWHESLDSLMYRWLGGPDSDAGERTAYNTHKDSEYIFITRKSPQMRSGHISRIVREAARAAGIQRVLGETSRSVPQAPEKSVPLYQISGHELRRASITHMVNKVDELALHQVQALAGHKRISQTRSYVSDDFDEIEKTMQNVEF